MMEEVSVMACDARAVDQMSEEEILACLVAETGPKFTVPTKKAKLRKSCLQIMDDEEEDQLDKYLKENRRLQQVSLCLEQENDNLAYRLITGKIALRNALDTAEDRADELSRDLLQTRRRLQATEDEMRGKEEEAAMLKEVFRREMDKAEQDVKRSSGIITEYKQICSQLTKRLEEQRAAHREELDSHQKSVKACRRCRHVIESVSAAPSDQDEHGSAEGFTTEEQNQDKDNKDRRKVTKTRVDQEKESLRAQIRDLEQELAQTKLQVVEAKCKIQVRSNHHTLDRGSFTDDALL
uniref:RAB GTPase activating protein 1-like 2 n=1 Tax=Sphaeramia orbicularis TaxID=375764 RepID=A0A672ZP24_9TELE